MKVLITKKTIDEGYYWTSVRRESRMKTQLATQEAIEELKLNAAEKIEAERTSKVLGKKEKSIVEEPVTSDIDDSLEEEVSDEDIEEIDLENENESKLEELKEKEAKEEQSLEDAIYEELAKNPQNQELVVYVDTREGNSKVIRALDTIGVKVKVNTMAVADYQVSEEVAIERKTAKDFVDSIVDKRLFKQARMMMEEFKKPVMILEGDDFYSGFINPNAIRGAMTSIALDYGISIIPTRTEEDTAAMIKRIAIREQKGEKRSIQIRTERKPQNLWEQQLFIIESLPNIGPVHAKRLLEHFGSVKAVLEADEKKLQEVEGIGKKTAKNIREVVEGKYLYFKKDDNQKKLK
jgi:Fanconi anemia group M protein